MRISSLGPNLLQRIDAILNRVMRSDDPMPICPICKSAEMRRHDWRGCVCAGCGTRIW